MNSNNFSLRSVLLVGFLFFISFLHNSSFSAEYLAPPGLGATGQSKELIGGSSFNLQKNVTAKEVLDILEFLRNNIGAISNFELEKNISAIELYVRQIKAELKLKNIDIDDDKITDLMSELRSRNGVFIKNIPNTVCDIYDSNDNPLNMSIVAGFVHPLELWHRVSNAFVFLESGKLLMELRSHMVVFQPNRLSISGGHCDFGETYETAIKRELREELCICGDKNTVVLGPYGQFLVDDKKNKEHRSLFLKLCDEEERAYISQFNQIMEGKTRLEYQHWLEDQKNRNTGLGEVWQFCEISVEELEEALNTDGKIRVESKFKDETLIQYVALTADMLLPLLNGTAMQRRKPYIKTFDLIKRIAENLSAVKNMPPLLNPKSAKAAYSSL